MHAFFIDLGMRTIRWAAGWLAAVQTVLSTNMPKQTSNTHTSKFIDTSTCKVVHTSTCTTVRV